MSVGNEVQGYIAFGANLEAALDTLIEELTNPIRIPMPPPTVDGFTQAGYWDPKVTTLPGYREDHLNFQAGASTLIAKSSGATVTLRLPRERLHPMPKNGQAPFMAAANQLRDEARQLLSELRALE